MAANTFDIRVNAFQVRALHIAMQRLIPAVLNRQVLTLRADDVVPCANGAGDCTVGEELETLRDMLVALEGDGAMNDFTS